ncbi:hypothetical protein VTJ83DRAFT_443 [Remersonia thermophila]|uniref:Uncharacterized protein n=1 Tax=Remersonia thermophila TaxID=72144 RepID=A0ABR4DL65_9PEZI
MKDNTRLLSSQNDDELPHLWQKPSYGELLACLEKLRVQLRVWNLRHGSSARTAREREQQQAASASKYDRREVISFLSSLISSPLAWLDSDEEREAIWDQASKRMAERCGRTAMGEITRYWPFEVPAADDGGDFTLAIREPPLTGDSLGLKTWGSSYALARLLPTFSAPSGPLAHLFAASGSGIARHSALGEKREILELGSGTGLLGLAAACLWGASVALTDLPDILPNLRHNAELNAEVLASRGGGARVAPLTWGGAGAEETDPAFLERMNGYQLVLVADPLYDDNHPSLLSRAIDEQLSLSPSARVLIMVPQRDATTKRLLGELRELLAAGSRALPPLRCLAEDIVHGQDDWGAEDDGPGNDGEEGDEDEHRKVGFWWGVFGREMGAAEVVMS